MRVTRIVAGAGWLILAASHAGAQTLALPSRPAGAPNGTQFTNIITSMALTERENWIYAQVISGNVPDFQRALVPVSVSATINGTRHTATYYAAPDYLAIGTDADYFLEPTTPLLAQRLGDALGCTLPTRKMVDQIWSAAPVKMDPQPITWSPQMITVPVFAQENYMVHTQRNSFTNSFPLGALVSGDKKDVVISTLIYSHLHSGVPKPVCIYGWHNPYGSHIQPLYNGHEETYADYSHGTRLVQNAITVDGSPNTVTNVLTAASLAALLSDEGPAEGTTSDGVIPLPRYTLAAMAPVIITHPRSQSVLPGASLSLRAFAIGDAPLSYRWQFNGTPIGGATNASLLLSNAQVANAGSYKLVVTNQTGSAATRTAVLRVHTKVHPILFADSFSTSTSSNWNLFWGAANSVADYSTNWACDYGTTPYTFNGVTALIPPAPNSPDGTTRALRLSVNDNDAAAAVAAVNLYPAGRSFSNDFALKFDMWINYPGGAGGINAAGSTQHALFGLNHLGTEVNWATNSASPSDGVWFAAAGEGGTTTDCRAYVGSPMGAPIDVSSTLTASDNIAPIYQNLFPAARFETAGSPGKNWVQVELRHTNNVLLWIMDGTVITQRTNTSSFTSGNLMIGFMDAYPSIANPADDAFALFANLRVEDLTVPALQPPVITSQPSDQSASAGGSATFTVAATGSAALSYQWRFNGTNISSASGSSFSVMSVLPANAGTYDVVVSNAAGLAASAAAVLVVNPSEVRFLSASVLTNGQVQLLFMGMPGQDYLVQASTNLATWLPIAVLTGSNGPLPFIDPDAASLPWRFYRAREASTQVLTDFEAYAPGTQVMFQPPTSSGSTSDNLNFTPNLAYVTNNFPVGHAGAKVLAASWGFKSGIANPWLRLTTWAAPNLPNPTISTNQAVQFDIYADRDLYVAIGFRETSTTTAIGADGGTLGTIEWIGAIPDHGIYPPAPPIGRLVPAGHWATLCFLLPYDPVEGFTGNGILETSTGKGVLEHLELIPAAGSGNYNLYLDNFRLTNLTP